MPRRRNGTQLGRRLGCFEWSAGKSSAFTWVRSKDSMPKLTFCRRERVGGSKNVGRHMAPKPGQGGILNDLMLPALQAAYDADARSTAVLRTLRIFNALRAFAEKN